MKSTTEYRDELNGDLLHNESLSKYTTWRVGGNAKQLYKPASLSDLSFFLNQLDEDEPLLWLGLGSNTLIRDNGFNGTVIVTQGCLRQIELADDNTVKVESGVSCATMARFCARNNLANSEFWAGIPGTMGGALRMNAGCYNGETWDKLIAVELIDRFGKITQHTHAEFDVAYRHVRGFNFRWFVTASFNLPKGDKAVSLMTIKQLLTSRNNSQPTSEYNCGSVFRNPDDDYAARLIEASGLKGKTIGNAQVSTKHANFIINKNGLASANDIETLINTVHDVVLDKQGIDLYREVHIIGDE